MGAGTEMRRRNVEEEEEGWGSTYIVMSVTQKRMNNEIGHEAADFEFCERSVDCVVFRRSSIAKRCSICLTSGCREDDLNCARESEAGTNMQTATGE
jgi:hypothetical protein